MSSSVPSLSFHLASSILPSRSLSSFLSPPSLLSSHFLSPSLGSCSLFPSSFLSSPQSVIPSGLSHTDNQRCSLVAVVDGENIAYDKGFLAKRGSAGVDLRESGVLTFRGIWFSVGERRSPDHGCRKGESRAYPTGDPNSVLHADDGGVASRSIVANPRGGRRCVGVVFFYLELFVSEMLRIPRSFAAVRVQELFDRYSFCFRCQIGRHHVFILCVMGPGYLMGLIWEQQHCVLSLQFSSYIFSASLELEPETTPSLARQKLHLKKSWRMPVLFLSSLVFALGHVVVAYRTSCRAGRKLQFHRVDPEAYIKHLQTSAIRIVLSNSNASVEVKSFVFYNFELPRAL
ncbi:putative hydrolase/acyltransferase alpha/beta hydrolase superfamily [Cinnamomum micranthum f. kanehirae]|uniref:Putative hydrolase/acyltransferase alpha/beta hydrolase superfamily n=1 Tax=Cinnamomum micranthum f. kanehirae TaxID=337451 RepID=A0A3S3MGE9_9MAGN|nr:putative hydrolase/acyltransferase alpha/beta hydrolase superfamily [Cinnamomum micranthum f. kanehirae]